MPVIKSEAYTCDNGKTLNIGRWWTDPITSSDRPNTVVLCGGNVPVARKPGVGARDCVSVDLDRCTTQLFSDSMATSRQALQPLCLTKGQCYLFGGNTNTFSENTQLIDLYSIRPCGQSF